MKQAPRQNRGKIPLSSVSLSLGKLAAIAGLVCALVLA